MSLCRTVFGCLECLFIRYTYQSVNCRVNLYLCFVFCHSVLYHVGLAELAASDLYNLDTQISIVLFEVDTQPNLE